MNVAPAAADRRSWLRVYMGSGPRPFVVRLVLLLVLGSLGYYLAAPQVFAYYHAWRAERALARYDCALARQHLEACLSVWPRSAQYHYEAARCCWRESDLDAAEMHLRSARKHGWPHSALELEFTLVQSQRHFSPQIETALKSFVKSPRGEARQIEAVLEALVRGLQQEQRFEESAAAARMLVEQDPQNWRAHKWLGSSLALNNPGLAVEAFQKSLALKVDQPSVHFWLANYHATIGQANESLEHLKKSGRKPLEDIEASRIAARGHYLLGERATARAVLESALARGGDKQGRLLALRGLVALEEEGPQAAVAWLARADAFAPYHVEVIDALSAVASRQNDKEKLHQIQERKQQLKVNMDQIGALHRKMNALIQDPAVPAADVHALMLRIAKTMLLVGEDQAAVRMLERLLHQSPDLVEAHQTLADTYRRLGDLDKAEFHGQRTAKQKGRS